MPSPSDTLMLSTKKRFLFMLKVSQALSQNKLIPPLVCQRYLISCLCFICFSSDRQVAINEKYSSVI